MDDLTYPEHGATAGSLPEGYHHLERQARLGSGRDVFERAAAALMSWRVHRAAGLAVTADGDARPGLRVVSRLAPGITAPCRVVYVIDEPDRRGFAYGTLRGHPESGEESFLVTIDKDGEVLFTVRAFTRPGTLLARAAGPVGRIAQRLVTERYVRGMRRLVAGLGIRRQGWSCRSADATGLADHPASVLRLNVTQRLLRPRPGGRRRGTD